MAGRIAVIALAILLVATQASAVDYYVNSVTGTTTGTGTLTKPFKDLSKISGLSLKAGDRVLLSGDFTTGFMIDLAKSNGTAANPVTITSLDPARRATITPSTATHAIGMYDGTGTATAKGLGIRITDLNIVGTRSAGRSGISLYKAGASAVDYLEIRRVNISNFAANAITVSRDKAAGYISNVIITDAATFNIPGAVGSGARGVSLVGVQGALVERCVAYGNGAANTTRDGFSFWAYDCSRVTFRNCSAYANNGGGFALDGLVSSSVIENCTSSNNWGHGYRVASRASEAVTNNTIRYSTSQGDGNGAMYGSILVSADGSSVSGLRVHNNIITVTDPKFCDFWGVRREAHWGLWLQLGTAANSNLTVTWDDNTVTCGNDGAVFKSNLYCHAPTAGTANCTQTGGPALPYRPFNYYVNSVSGNDSLDGRSPSTAWKTLDQVSNWNWGRYAFKAGDNILLSGTFTSKMYLALSKSYGNASMPITITSQDPSKRAKISPVNGDHAISLYDSATAPALGLGIRITDLDLVGHGILDPAGRPSSGIFVYKEGANNVDYLEIRRVKASNFTLVGMGTNRAVGAGFMTNVVITDCTVFDNPGFANITRPIGGGVSLGGVEDALIERCVAYNNGVRNNNPTGGPVGFWTYDSNRVIMRNCTSHDNKSSKSDGAGFDMDLAVNNSLIENCTAYNNYGSGFEVCTGREFYSNNNNTIRYGTSVGDGWGTGYASISVWNAEGTSKVNGLSIYGMDVTVVDPDVPCGFWGSDQSKHYGLWMWGNHSDTRWFNNRVTCKDTGAVYTDNLSCGTIGGGTAGTGRAACASLDM